MSDNGLVGAVLRLKGFKSYSPEPHPTIQTVALRDRKKHIVVVVIAGIPSNMVIDQAFIEERMRFLGWRRIPEEAEAKEVPAKSS